VDEHSELAGATLQRRPGSGTDGAPGPRFQADVRRSRHGVTFVRVQGDLDAAAAPELDRMLTVACGENGSPHVVLDLEHVHSAAAEVVDVLLHAEARLSAAGGGLQLLAPSPAVVLMMHGAG